MPPCHSLPSRQGLNPEKPELFDPPGHIPVLHGEEKRYVSRLPRTLPVGLTEEMGDLV